MRFRISYRRRRAPTDVHWKRGTAWSQACQLDRPCLNVRATVPGCRPHCPQNLLAGDRQSFVLDETLRVRQALQIDRRGARPTDRPRACCPLVTRSPRVGEWFGQFALYDLRNSAIDPRSRFGHGFLKLSQAYDPFLKSLTARRT